MRKHSCILIIALVTMMAMPIMTVAQTDEKTLRRQHQEWYAKVVDAYKRKDAKGFAMLFTPDVKGVTWDGKKIMGRKALEEYTREDMAAIVSIESAKAVISKIALKNGKMVVEGTEIWKYKMLDANGTYGAKGKTYNVLWKQVDQATFRKTSQGWQQEEYHYLTKPDLTVGGKPLLPKR
jgi:uncharacterized protein (TIGR02246 family)